MGPTAQEQLTLEYINALRTDPGGEYARLTDPARYGEISNAISFFGVDLSALQTQLGALTAVAPLAWNENLKTAATAHNLLMIAQDKQEHQLPGELGLGDRLNAAGYTGWNRIGENIFAFTRSEFYGHAGFVVDWGYDAQDFDAMGNLFTDWKTRGDGIQDPAGHRNNLMSTNFTEIGIAITAESNPATSVGPNVITHDLGNRFGYQAQFLGVLIDDQDNDDFYDIGEGMGGVTVTLSNAGGTYVTTTWDSGGWQIAVPNGTYSIVFTGGALGGKIQTTASISGSNVKLDFEASDATGITLNGDEGDNALTGTNGTDTLSGLGGNDTLNGLAGADILIGGAGNDYLIGGPGAANEMYGGTGNDTYEVSVAGDSVIELAGEGTDQVRTALDRFVLPVNVEQLVYTGTGAFNGVGNDGDNFIQGGTGADTLDGGLGSDTLLGGAGNDILIGGTGAANEMIGSVGDDVYFVSVTGDSVVELAGEGIDQVRTDIARYVLNANVEQLVYSGTGDFNGVGSDDANLIQGGAGNDILDGLGGNDVLVGGAGDDILIGGSGMNEMQGGLGNDTYFVSSTGDSVVEGVNEGTDRVLTDAALYVLGNNVENLTYNGQGTFRGEGNDLANLIVGGAGNDVLLGHGGNDTILGGTGNDLIEGGAGDDSLSGGLGADTLTGGAGADRFVFDTALGGGNTDHVTDFATGVDGFQLDHTIFTALGTGALAASQFVLGTAAQDADDRIVYDAATGTLYYDADGNGAGSAVAFATIGAGLTLAASDLVVI